MKKYFIIINIFLTVAVLFSDNIFLGEIPEFPEQPVLYYYQTSNDYLIFSDEVLWDYITKNSLSIVDGFYIANNFYNKSSSQLAILEGNMLILRIEWYYPWNWEKNTREENQVLQDYSSNYTLEEWKIIKSKNDLGITKENWNKIVIYNDGIKKISASSSYKETISNYMTTYSVEGLCDRLFWVIADEPIDLNFDSKTPPWVEGVEGYGIGEYLDIEFEYSSDEIQILNGFVDFSRMHLYKDNSRVKRIRIDSENPSFSQEYELEDLVKYNVLTLPQPTDKIRITILDVYPGRRWQDTCLSSILVTDPDLPPYEEQKEKIINLMKENGVMEKIEAFKRENGL